MSNVFSTLQTYAGNWSVKSSRAFSSEEIAAVRKAEVVPSQYGSSVCFYMMSGGQTYIPLSRDSECAIGTSVDLKTARLLTLERDGQDDILRVSI